MDNQVKVRLDMGRAGESYFMVIRIGPAHGQLLRLDLTAEQYAQLVTNQQINVTAEFKQL